MGQKLVIGPFNKGLRNDVTAFNIDNDSFPTLENSYQWRGRVKRKRGTSFLTHLNRFFNSTLTSYNTGSSTIVLDGTGNGNLISGFSLDTNGNIAPGSINILDTVSAINYTDPTQDGYLTPSGTGGPNTIVYSTGAIHIPAAAGHTITVSFIYNPTLPVMGLRDVVLLPTQFPSKMAFDTKYSYNILTSFPYPNYSVSFYKNPVADAINLPGYIPKTNSTPTSWNGQNYQQFWTTNYEGAFWATNGISVPFISTNIGMQFKPIVSVTITAVGPPAIADLAITGHGLSIGDFVFINEVLTTQGINWQTGYVIATPDANTVSVEFPKAILTGNGTGGIAQYLTNRSDITKDCLRYYDGDPTNGSASAPVLTQGHGWVNFMPPLSQSAFSIANLPPAIYYLVGAKIIVPYKDRLLFLAPVVSNSGGGVFFLQDTVIYSQNGTPYYTASYQNTPNSAVDFPTSATNNFFPILVPDNQIATTTSYFEDQTGFGGFVSAGLSQTINTVSGNEDVLIVGFNNFQTRLPYSGNDLVPFTFFLINSELGSGSTFSVINQDQGVITRGSRGFILTSQTSAQRIDLDIPDEVFQLDLTNNGNERFCAARDFLNEWIYFTYPVNSDSDIFPNQTLFYNYRDNSWSIFRETYTCYGSLKRRTGFTWQTVGMVYETWQEWNDPWNAGTSTLLQEEVIGGNTQGFVLVRDEGTGEGTSLYIQSFSNGTNIVTSPNHNLDNGNYIIISNALGDVAPLVNTEIFSVFNVSTNTFQLNPDPLITSETYFGGGLITLIYVPVIQTKQFALAWDMARKTRIGVQQYLLTKTNESQITLQIFLSQNAASAYNEGPINPDVNSINDSLIYSSVLYTCPESTNLGLMPSSLNMSNPANSNLQMVTASNQSQIWHRKNTSLLGDTVQLGFTLSDAQIRDLESTGVLFPITNATQANPCVLTCNGSFKIGQQIKITEVVGMTQLNDNVYQVIASDATTVTIKVNSSSFDAYISGGFAQILTGINAYAEIELHGFIIDVTPSSMLA